MEPVAGQPGRRGGRGARAALTGRAAGWVVAAVLAGAVIALSVVLTTASSTTLVQQVGAPRYAHVPLAAGPPGRALAQRVQVVLPGRRVPPNVLIPPAVLAGRGRVLSPGLLPVCRVPAGVLVLVPAAATPARLPGPVRVQLRRPAPEPVPACPAGLRVQVSAGRAPAAAG
jgi:hypothetical protein